MSSPATTSVEMKQLKEFTLLPKLPLELRLKIWKDALAPRLVGITHIGLRVADRWGLYGAVRIPGVHQASQKSRHAAGYVVIANSWQTKSSDSWTHTISVLFHPGHDIVFFKDVALPRMYDLVEKIPAVYKSIRRLSLSKGSLPRTSFAMPPKFKFGLYQFWELLLESAPDLKEVIIMYRNGPLEADIEDLYELYLETDALMRDIERPTILSTFRKAQDIKGLLKSVELKFMRVERWER